MHVNYKLQIHIHFIDHKWFVGRLTTSWVMWGTTFWMCVIREHMKSSCLQHALLSHLNMILELSDGISNSDLTPLCLVTHTLFFLVVILPCPINLLVTQGEPSLKCYIMSQKGCDQHETYTNTFEKKKSIIWNSEDSKTMFHIAMI